MVICVGPMLAGTPQGYNPWPRLLIVLLNTSAHVPERFA
jgi:hypothetical protein